MKRGFGDGSPVTVKSVLDTNAVTAAEQLIIVRSRPGQPRGPCPKLKKFA